MTVIEVLEPRSIGVPGQIISNFIPTVDLLLIKGLKFWRLTSFQKIFLDRYIIFSLRFVKIKGKEKKYYTGFVFYILTYLKWYSLESSILFNGISIK